jgi:hypothetical protein
VARNGVPYEKGKFILGETGEDWNFRESLGMIDLGFRHAAIVRNMPETKAIPESAQTSEPELEEA